MTTVELNALPHKTGTELNAIPSIKLKFTAAATVPDYLRPCITRVFDAVETPDGWEGSQRVPTTGHFGERQMFSRSTYELA